MGKNPDDWTSEESSSSSEYSNCSITDKVLEILDEEEKRIEVSAKKKTRCGSKDIDLEKVIDSLRKDKDVRYTVYHFIVL